ncbi:TSUP family transporter [Bacterioplanoides sp. SCSIO 12839]|uniref:TSUP family transporter n=1 Tax=Bacterioplanoides sp. SCSIO 12839 TaxID=2829569 RepID=UPI002102C78E|nr:TSUP family transporter [Bacterioplanoides sp. SCSIO 12839]UTW47080.1 TSUP family transporter [Bacterioplanoides sp. SCSIO 12839]
MLEFSWEILALLAAVAMAAGFIDAVAGGGGLLTIPALLFAGVPPVQAIATNKLQACFGSFTATRFFVREKLVSPKEQKWAIVATAVGAVIGAIAIQLFDSALLVQVMPYGLIAIAVYLLLARNFGKTSGKETLKPATFNATVATGVGVYDGFFGPGTGTFFSLGYSKLRGMNLIEATAHAKLLNFTTNIVSLAVFILSGQILFQVGFAMAAGQALGARLGAAAAVKQGVDFIRYMTVFVCIAMSISLLLKS